MQQNLELCEAHQKSLNDMEELKKFQSSTCDTIARRRLVEDQDTILELAGKIQELQNEINCINDSRNFQDPKSIRSGQSHVTSRPVSFPPHPIPEGMLSRSFGVPQRRAAKRLGHTCFVGKRFCKSSCVLFSTSSAGIESMEFRKRKLIHSSTVEKNENQTPVQDQRCQSGPSAKNSVIPCEGDSLGGFGTYQQRLQISDLHFDTFPTPATFACWKIRFKTESNHPQYPLQEKGQSGGNKSTKKRTGSFAVGRLLS